MVGRALIGYMGIYPNSETCCDNFSFFGRGNLDGRKRKKNVCARFIILGKCPYPIGARPTIKALLISGQSRVDPPGLTVRLCLTAMCLYTYC